MDYYAVTLGRDDAIVFALSTSPRFTYHLKEAMTFTKEEVNEFITCRPGFFVFAVPIEIWPALEAFKAISQWSWPRVLMRSPLGRKHVISNY
jgi:hypothetical protein